MKTYLLLFIISACVSLVLTPVVSRFSRRFGWLDVPDDKRRVHQKAVPRLGGIAIFATVLLTLAALTLIDNHVTQIVRANSAQVLRVLVPAALVFLFGLYDDFRGTNARFKFITLGLAGLIFYLMGGRVEILSIPLLGSVALPPVLGCALTVLWIIGIANAFNLIDGVDGLATGAALFASMVLLAVSLMLGHPQVTVVVVVLCGALIGFLRYNFNPASVFLGDSGSLFIGFTLAALAVQGAQKASTAVAVAIPLVAFGLPVLDTGVAIVRRFLSKRPIFDGDREHIHHKLLERGWSQRRVALALYGLCALFGLLALLFVNDTSMRMTGFVLLVIAAAVLFIVGRLRYHEVDEVRAGMKRSFGERRLRMAQNIQVRRASRMMSNATSISQILSALQELLQLSEFIYAIVQIRPGNTANPELPPAREQHIVVRREAEVLPDGCINWTWERGDIEAEEIIGSGRFWSLRLPLSTDGRTCGYLNLYREFGSDVLLLDMDYLCNYFQREMAEAVERVLSDSSGQARIVC